MLVQIEPKIKRILSSQRLCFSALKPLLHHDHHDHEDMVATDTMKVMHVYVLTSKAMRGLKDEQKEKLCDQKKLVHPAYARGLSRDHLAVRQILHLQHDHADLLHTLDDGFWGARDCHCTLCGVGQHVARHLDLGAGGLRETMERRRRGRRQ